MTDTAQLEGSGMTRTFVGPHEGRELELMTTGTKPLSAFLEVISEDVECFPEEDFDALVAQGRLTKAVSITTSTGPDGTEHQLRRVLYALPGEEWRIKALLLVQDLYDSLVPGWRPDLERVIGLLLGYDRQDIERFVASLSTRSASS
jgi:hypothetical protein